MNNEDLWSRRQAAIPAGVGIATNRFVARAENAEVWDVEGRRYIDFAGGIGVLSTGHRHPKVMAAALEQLDRFTHTAFQVLPYEPYIALAERLNALAPMSGPVQSLFFTTGVEAVENAVKIARAATGRPAVISFTGAFHGRTTLGMALTGKVAPYKRAFPSSSTDIYRLPFPGPHNDVTVEGVLRALDLLFSSDAAPERVAAIIIEPVQGEGGFYLAPFELLRALREVCDAHGILLICDEVQSGVGRTGRMFAIEHSGVQPDVVAVAKSLAGGFPLSGVIARSEHLAKIEAGGLGGTYAGWPAACAAALAVLDVIAEERLLERATQMGERLRARIATFATRNDLVRTAGLRGLGAMIAFDVVDAGGAFDGPAAKRVTQRALDNGLILLTCGGQGQAIRLMSPLTASDTLVDEAMDILEDALRLEPAA